MRKLLAIGALAAPLLAVSMPAQAVNRCAIALERHDRAERAFTRWFSTTGRNCPQGRLCNDGGEGARLSAEWSAAQAEVRRWCN